MNGLDYGPKFGRKPSAESQQIIAEQAERIRQLEAALKKSDPWKTEYEPFRNVCVHCGEVYDALRGGEPKDFHKPNCVWLKAVQS